MGIVQRQSIKFLITNYIGVVVGYVNTVLLFTNILTLDQFGLTRLLFSIALVVTQVAQLGAPNIVIRFYPFLKEKILSRGLVLCAGGIAVLSAILLIFKPFFIDYYREESPLIGEYYFLIIPFFIALVLNNLLDAYLKTQFKNVFANFLHTVGVRLLWMIIIILYYFQLFDFSTFVILFSLVHYVSLLILIFYIKSRIPVDLNFTVLEEDRRMFKSIKSFGFFTILSGMSSFFINKVDIIMLGGYEGSAAVAVYAIAGFMCTVISEPAISIGKTANVLVAKAFKDNDSQVVSELYQKSAINQLILSSAIYLIILVNYNNLMHFLPEEYAAGYMAFLFLGFGRVVDTGTGINGLILINSRYFKIDTLLSVFLLIMTIVSNAILIPLYQLEGAAIATLFSVFIYNLLRLLAVWYFLGYWPFSLNYLLAFAILPVTYLVVDQIPFIKNVYFDIIVRSGIIGLFYLLLITFSDVSADLKSLVTKTLGIKL